MTRGDEVLPLANDPLWYKDAVIYEVHVRAFRDSDFDGIGDFRGLTEKLDYLQDLGVTAIWLLPFYPSPLRDDGYDIADYTSVHPNYGKLQDFKVFLQEAHRRGLRVITELVVNHTSDQHPWFQRARRSPPGSPHRDFYVWSDTPEKYQEARIIFKDFETSNWAWDPVARAYYWHRFYSHQPDLNFDNPEVCKALFPVIDFWMGMGVDAMRLDAVPYLFEREGTNCENLRETHEVLKALRRHVDEKYPNRMFLAEANQWPEDAIAYFGAGDECQMAFHFPVMPRMFMALRTEDRFPILDIMAQTPPIPPNCQWALFLRNHDELTLEMVTDEERDYMYRVYAQDPQARINLGIRRRLAPLLENNRRRVELLNGLLFSLPGTPVIYYGDEIGMGDNFYLGDRNGVRTPMQWSSDRNAGFSGANPQRLYLPVIIDPEYHYETCNVDAQRKNPNSLLWWMKRLIALRKRYKAFGRGTLEFLSPDNPKVLAFVRRYEDETILVVANLSRFMQYAQLDLSAFQGRVMLELFGRTEFPAVEKYPYMIMLGPHGFSWFSLEQRRTPTGEVRTEPEVPALTVKAGWDRLWQGRGRAALEEVLPGYLQQRRWFGGKERNVRSVTLQDQVPVPYGDATAYLALVHVEYLESDPETYALPLAFAPAERAEKVLKKYPHAAVARLPGADGGLVYDALSDTGFCIALVEAMANGTTFAGGRGELVASATAAFAAARGEPAQPLEPSLSRTEQSNSSLVYGDRLILKLFRRVEEGMNPDLEIGRFLTEKRAFPHTPPVAGALEYVQGKGGPVSLAILQRFMPHESTGWQYTLDALGSYCERVLASNIEPPRMALSTRAMLDLTDKDTDPLAASKIEAYLESARVLGQRTGELHVALAGQFEDPDFAPEPFTSLYQRSVYQSMRNQAGKVFDLLAKRRKHLPEAAQEDAQRVQDSKEAVMARYRSLLERKVSGTRTRTHGDYHLGQVLYTGKDFIIIDFEGEPTRSLSERRLKRSPLRDVAGMLRSFHYAANTALLDQAGGRQESSPRDVAKLEPWLRFWYLWVCVAFLRAYLQAAAKGGFLPADRDELAVLANAYLLEKAVYELGYELKYRPDWVRIPMQGILQLLQTGKGA